MVVGLRRLGRLSGAGLLTLSAALWLGPLEAAAQPPGGYRSSAASYQAPVVLIGLKASAGKAGETRLELDFSGPAPLYTVMGDGAKPALALAQTSRGSSATFATRAGGLLQGVDFDQKSGLLILNFSVASPAQPRVTAGGPRSLIVSFAGVAADADGAAQRTSGAGLPR